MTAAVPVAPTRASMRPTDRAVNPSSIPNRTVTQQHFFTGSARPSQPGFNRGANSAAVPVGRPNTDQPSNRQQNFGQPNNAQPNNRPQNNGAPSIGQSQQNAVRPGFQRFGGSGNSSPAQSAQQSTAPGQGQRTFTPTPQRPPTPTFNQQGGRTGNYGAPPSQPQSNPAVRSNQVPAGNSQPNYRQPEAAPRQPQPYTRPSYGNSGSTRPALQVQQPIVTRRSQAPSAPRSAPSGEGSRGGSSRGSSSSGERSGRH